MDVACQYVVAADGAGSPLRRMANLVMEGEAELQNLISVHFLSKDLGQQLLATPEPGMLYFVFNSQVIAVVVAHNLEAGEFVAQVSTFHSSCSYSVFIFLRNLVIIVSNKGIISFKVSFISQTLCLCISDISMHFKKNADTILSTPAMH